MIPIIEISAPDIAASMNCLVPDLAIVPRLLIKSALVIPIPVSHTSTVTWCGVAYDRSVSVPPEGIASSALLMRLART